MMAQAEDVPRSMEARVGRHKQRYGPNGERLVGGVVPLSADHSQVLLIQSSSRKGWVLPKGGWETDETQEEGALREAWEEAGIHCEIERDLGDILEGRSEAQLHSSASSPKALYRFYQVRVTAEKHVWPESEKRSRKWMPFGVAREMLQHRPELLEALLRSDANR